MVVYSELISPEAVLRGVGNAKKVTIIACPHCANLSVAYAKAIPFGKARGGDLLSMITSKPSAIIGEAKKIKELLESKGIKTKIEVLAKLIPPCGLSEAGYRKIQKISRDSDCVIALCCVSGCLGIKNALPKKCKIFPAMNTVGWMKSFRKIENGHLVLDKEKSRVIYAKGQEKSEDQSSSAKNNSL